jgi:hypothetical protein
MAWPYSGRLDNSVHPNCYSLSKQTNLTSLFSLLEKKNKFQGSWKLGSKDAANEPSWVHGNYRPVEFGLEWHKQPNKVTTGQVKKRFRWRWRIRIVQVGGRGLWGWYYHVSRLAISLWGYHGWSYHRDVVKDVEDCVVCQVQRPERQVNQRCNCKQEK